MRSTHVFVLFLCCGLANAQLGGLISGLVSGLVKGGIEGTVGAFYPIAKDGMKVGWNMFQASMQAGFGFMQQLMSAAPTFFTQMQKMFGDMFSTNMKVMQNLGGMASSTMSSIMGMFSNGLSGVLGAFGGMTNRSQRSVFGLFQRADSAASAVLKLRLNKLSKASHEIPHLRLALEAPHKNPKHFFDDLKSKAPVIGDTLKTMYEKATAEFQHGFGQLEGEAKTGVKKIQSIIAGTVKGIQQKIGGMDGKQKKEFGTSFHLMNNAVHAMHVAI